MKDEVHYQAEFLAATTRVTSMIDGNAACQKLCLIAV